MKEYIEREKLILHIKDLPTWWADDGGVYGQAMKYPDGMFDCEDVINSIESAPTADVAPVVHGEWITCCNEPRLTSTSAGASKFWFECSLCGRQETQKEPYCHCGAKMDGGNLND